MWQYSRMAGMISRGAEAGVKAPDRVFASAVADGLDTGRAWLRCYCPGNVTWKSRVHDRFHERAQVGARWPRRVESARSRPYGRHRGSVRVRGPLRYS